MLVYDYEDRISGIQTGTLYRRYFQPYSTLVHVTILLKNVKSINFTESTKLMNIVHLYL
jgi:hypothetical protein